MMWIRETCWIRDMWDWWLSSGTSGKDPNLRPRISVGTMSKDVGMSSLPVFVTAPHMSVSGDNTAISNDGIARLGLMVHL